MTSPFSWCGWDERDQVTRPLWIRGLEKPGGVRDPSARGHLGLDKGGHPCIRRIRESRNITVQEMHFRHPMLNGYPKTPQNEDCPLKDPEPTALICITSKLLDQFLSLFRSAPQRMSPCASHLPGLSPGQSLPFIMFSLVLSITIDVTSDTGRGCAAEKWIVVPEV